VSAIAAKGLIFQVFSLGLFLLFSFASIDRSAAEISFKKTTVTYREIDGHKILADVYRPQDAKIRPVIVWIHGGALIVGNRDLEKSDFLLAFAEAEGCAVVSVDYRLAPETKLPDIISDIKEAFRWLAGDGAKQFHLDPRRIVVTGASAGGYLTLVTGYRVRPKPKALVALYGFGAFGRYPCHRSGAGRDIENDHIWTEITLIKQQRCPRLEQPRHQYLLVCSRDGVVSELEARSFAHGCPLGT
jgi:acetyl esterase/lipase